MGSKGGLMRYVGWRLRNPLRTYRDFYAQDVKKRVAKGSVPAWIKEPPSSEMLDFLLTLGLAPEDMVVDYGCGSLRFGRAVIGHQAVDRYHGMDIDEEFYLPALNALPEELSRKRPTCSTISDEGLAHARTLRPKFIASWQVIPVIPPWQQVAYFRSMTSLAAKGSTIAADIFETRDDIRLSPMSWGKSREFLAKCLREADPGLVADFVDSPVKMSDAYRHTIMIIRR